MPYDIAASDPADSADPQPQPQTLPQVLPSFTPVPRQMNRINGWRPEVQLAFIEALAETGSVRRACARVRRADHGAYQLRRHPEAEEFRRAWDAALDIAVRRIEDVAMDRALNGVTQPVYSYGEHVGDRTVYNDRLLTFMLRNRVPERYGAGGGGDGGGGAANPLRLAQLKQQWRKEWQRERMAAGRASQESIMAKLMQMRDHVIAESRRASPHVVALLDAYEEAAEEEKRNGPPEPLPLLPGVHWRLEGRFDFAEEDAADWEEVE